MKEYSPNLPSCSRVRVASRGWERVKAVERPNRFLSSGYKIQNLCMCDCAPQLVFFGGPAIWTSFHDNCGSVNFIQDQIVFGSASSFKYKIHHILNKNTKEKNLEKDPLLVRPLYVTMIAIIDHETFLGHPWVNHLTNGRAVPAIFLVYLFSSPRAESARAVTGRRNSHRGEGGRLFEPSAGFFYGNSSNSGTKSRKIVSKVGN